MIEVIVDTLIDSIKLLPFLFISYVIIEYIEHKSSEKINKILSNSGKYSKVLGSLVGAIPQCGFSAIAANLFSSRVITIGTLVAVFLATSDEAIPVLLTYPEKSKEMIIIILLKVIIAIVAGTVIDLIFNNTKKDDYNEEEMHEHVHDMCKNCNCENGILKSSLKHTFSIFTFLVLINFVINTLVWLVGEDVFKNIILSGSLLQPFVASIIGLIPNCAASVLLSKLFVDGSLSIGSIIAGLSTGAGIGTIVLFKTNKDMKENLTILGIVYSVGVLCGIVIDLVVRLI